MFVSPGTTDIKMFFEVEIGKGLSMIKEKIVARINIKKADKIRLYMIGLFSLF